MEISNSSTDVEVGSTDIQVTEQVSDEVVPKKDYDSLQSASTKWRQDQIDLARELVNSDKSKINSIKDKKVRDIVVKDVFGYSTYEEMVAIEGSDFAKSKESSETDDLQRQVKILSYKYETKELETAIAEYKRNNPDFFLMENAEEILRANMKLISGVDVAEKIRMAGAIALNANTMNSTTAAYKQLAGANVSRSNGATPDTKTKTEGEENANAIVEFLFKK